jgi:hypothetical protein
VVYLLQSSAPQKYGADDVEITFLILITRVGLMEAGKNFLRTK